MIGQLLKKYFSNDCSDSEKKILHSYFMENPSSILEYFSEEEWIVFKDDDTISEMTHQDELLLKNIYATDYKKKWKKRYRYAAIIIGLICLPMYFLLFHKNKQQSHSEGLSKELKIQYSQKWVTEQNISDLEKKVILSDSSIVCLSKNAKIAYLENFSMNRRELYLEGTAIFSISKDTTRPFTVYCGEVATTALGTQFIVSSDSHKKVTVKLIEGKVLVYAHKENHPGQQKYILSKNQKLNFDQRSKTFSFTGDREEIKISKSEPLKPNYKKFDNIPLSQVFDYISKRHNVKISYNAESIRHIRFAGTLFDTDPVIETLQSVTKINNLVLSVDTINNSYLIR